MSAQVMSAPHVSFTIAEMENGFRPKQDGVREKFAWLSDVMRSYSGCESRYFTCVESPDKVYQFGGWNSVEEHYWYLHCSPLVDDVLDEFGGVLDIKASWHADALFKTLPLDDSHLTFARFWVPKTLRSEFESELHRWLPGLVARCGKKIAHGWRLAGGWQDQEAEDDLALYDPSLVGRFDVDPEETDEWDVVLPWSSAEDWKTEFDMAEFTRILQNVARLEVKHLQPLILDGLDH